MCRREIGAVVWCVADGDAYIINSWIYFSDFILSVSSISALCVLLQCLHPYTVMFTIVCRYIHIVAIIMYQKEQTKNVYYIRYIGVMAVEFCCFVFFFIANTNYSWCVFVSECLCLHIILFARLFWIRLHFVVFVCLCVCFVIMSGRSRCVRELDTCWFRTHTVWSLLAVPVGTGDQHHGGTGQLCSES